MVANLKTRIHIVQVGFSVVYTHTHATVGNLSPASVFTYYSIDIHNIGNHS